MLRFGSWTVGADCCVDPRWVGGRWSPSETGRLPSPRLLPGNRWCKPAHLNPSILCPHLTPQLEHLCNTPVGSCNTLWHPVTPQYASVAPPGPLYQSNRTLASVHLT